MVGYETITAPDGWRDRLIEYSNENTDGVTGLCLEINNLWLTKLAAGRPKDFEFCRARVRAKLITSDIGRSRMSTIDSWIEDLTNLLVSPTPPCHERRPMLQRRCELDGASGDAPPTLHRS